MIVNVKNVQFLTSLICVNVKMRRANKFQDRNMKLLQYDKYGHCSGQFHTRKWSLIFHSDNII